MTEVFQIKQATWMSEKDGECEPVVVPTERESDEDMDEFCKRHEARVDKKLKECPPKSEVMENEFFLLPE